MILLEQSFTVRIPWLTATIAHLFCEKTLAFSATVLPAPFPYRQQSTPISVFETVKPRLHDATCCQTGLTTGWTNGCIV